jgi:tetratricopeptide (TPR) repeat protein
MELGSLDEAAREFDIVLQSAPDNLAAIRGLAEIHQRRGAMADALEYYRRALDLARFDPDLRETVQRISRELGEVGAPREELSFEEAHSQLLSAASRIAEARTASEAAQPSGATDPQDGPRAFPRQAESHEGHVPVGVAGADEDGVVLSRRETYAADAHGVGTHRADAQIVQTPAAHASPAGDDAGGAPLAERDAQHDRSGAPPMHGDAAPLVNFDALLASLGVPDASPPPGMDMLLSDSLAGARLELPLPDLPAEPPQDDPLAALEEGLRAFDLGLVENVPATSETAVSSATPVALVKTAEDAKTPADGPERAEDLESAAAAAMSAHTEALASVDDRTGTHRRSDDAGGPEARASGTAGDRDEILADLEAWLAALAEGREGPS